MELSIQIKTILLHKNMTQGNLASLLKTSQQNVSKKLITNDFKLSELKIISDVLDQNLTISAIDKGNAIKDITSDLFDTKQNYKIKHIIDIANILGYRITVNFNNKLGN